MKCVIYKILLWVERLFLFVLGPQGVRFNVEGFCVGLNLRLREG